MSEKTLSEIVVEFRETAVLVSKNCPRENWIHGGRSLNLSYQMELPSSVMFAMVINSSTHSPQMKPRGKITLTMDLPYGGLIL